MWHSVILQGGKLPQFSPCTENFALFLKLISIRFQSFVHQMQPGVESLLHLWAAESKQPNFPSPSEFKETARTAQDQHRKKIR